MTHETHAKFTFAIIGGSGFYSFVKKTEQRHIETPYGKITAEIGSIDDINFVFLPRHGTEHQKLAHQVNHKANIYALFKLGVKVTIATNAVGSLNKEIKPGDLAFPNQLLAFWLPPLTFFDEFNSITTHRQKKEGLVHEDFTNPYCPFTLNIAQRVVQKKYTDLQERIHFNVTYTQTFGPRFETPAEIRALKMLGADIVGMTGGYEASLAREVDICYLSIALCTNFAAGIQKQITVNEVLNMFQQRQHLLFQMISDITRELAKIEKNNPQEFNLHPH